MTEDITLLKEIIWHNQGITSYGLLAEYIKQGYTYTKHGDKCFDKLIKSLKNEKDIIYTKEKDSFKIYKTCTLPVMLDSIHKRQNCYDCLFCIEAKGKKDEYTCSLNPTLELRLSMTYITDKCPINVMINDINKESGVD